MVEESEVQGLVALMEFHTSRFATRTDKAGSLILLLDQDRSRWDWSLISSRPRRLEAREGPDADARPLSVAGYDRGRPCQSGDRRRD
jgi:hypothetical protein